MTGSRRRRIALVADATDARTALAGYLVSAGFDVHACDKVARPASFSALVAVTARDDGDAWLADVRSWIKVTEDPRIVVVTTRPTLFRALAAAHGGRLCVLAAPAFGWAVVDALRAVDLSLPRGV
ncbi:MAG: hypothetical protein IPL61_17235 [Myxococcales bacterium]|nr:hypothetical protein [Myxococcales bacterium]